jgi:predicted DNA-binding transcriptional regulator AlpA
MQYSETKIIRFSELKKKLGVSRSTIDRWEKAKCFPLRIQLGKNSIGWNLQAIDKWLREREDDNA